jgi:hypothetical protein
MAIRRRLFMPPGALRRRQSSPDFRAALDGGQSVDVFVALRAAAVFSGFQKL